MREEAEEAEKRGTDGRGIARRQEEQDRRRGADGEDEGREMMKTYLDRGSDDLDGFEFLTMAEAGEVGHWADARTLNKQAKQPERAASSSTGQLAIQQRHLEDARDGCEPDARGEGGSERAAA